MIPLLTLTPPIPFIKLTLRIDYNKLYNFQGYIYASSFDIACVTETWLNSEILDFEILPKGYDIYQRDRGHQGGGYS